jgi:hypothetical protein
MLFGELVVGHLASHRLWGKVLGYFTDFEVVIAELGGKDWLRK